MKIKQISIDGFRCLCNITITFEDDITLVVGENDSGKSSLINCLDLLTQEYSLERDDFNYEKEEDIFELMAAWGYEYNPYLKYNYKFN